MQIPLFKSQTEWIKPEERLQLNLFDEEEEVFFTRF